MSQSMDLGHFTKESKNKISIDGGTIFHNGSFLFTENSEEVTGVTPLDSNFESDIDIIAKMKFEDK